MICPTVGAAKYALLPAWLASTPQLPGFSSVTTFPEMLQLPLGTSEKLTGSPELAVALTVTVAGDRAEADRLSDGFRRRTVDDDNLTDRRSRRIGAVASLIGEHAAITDVEQRDDAPGDTAIAIRDEREAHRQPRARGGAHRDVRTDVRGGDRAE